MKLILLVLVLLLSGCVVSPIPNCPDKTYPQHVPGEAWFLCVPEKDRG